MTGLWFPAGFALAGLGFGLAYFAALRRTVDLYVAGHSRFLATALTIGRLVAAVLFCGFAARFGALSLLVALLGFLAARSLALRAARRAA